MRTIWVTLKNDSNIRDYAATNEAEFMAVVTEYFYERPHLLEKHHPKLHDALKEIFDYKHPNSIKWGIKWEINSKVKTTQRNSPCPCGSGLKFKICCMKLSS